VPIFFQVIANGLVTFAIYVLVAGGISFLYAATRIFHLANGVVVLGAGYVFWWAWVWLGWHPAAAVVFSLVISSAVGLLMNEFVYEPLRRRGTKGLGYLIATLALLIFGTAVVMALFGAQPRTFDFQTASLVFGGVYMTVFQLWALMISILLLIVFFWIIRFTRFGKALRATADNETVAEVLGVDTKMLRRWAFLLASLFAAVGGILNGLEFNLDPNMGLIFAVRGFTAAVIGGVGSFGGAIIGSGLVSFLEQAIVWFFGAGWRNAIVFILLFLFLLLRPGGIFGSKN